MEEYPIIAQHARQNQCNPVVVPFCNPSQHIGHCIGSDMRRIWQRSHSVKALVASLEAKHLSVSNSKEICLWQFLACLERVVALNILSTITLSEAIRQQFCPLTLAP